MVYFKRLTPEMLVPGRLKFLNDPLPYRVTAKGGDNRNSRRDVPCGAHRYIAAAGYNDIALALHKFSGQLRQSSIVTHCPAVIDFDIHAPYFNPPAASPCLNGAMNVPDHSSGVGLARKPIIGKWYLSDGDCWSCNNTAKQRDEVSPIYGRPQKV